MTVVLVVLAALVLPAAAAARSRFCTGGDTCGSEARRGRQARDRHVSARRSSLPALRHGTGHVKDVPALRLVVSGRGEIAGSSVRWSRHFPRKGPGRYFVGWALGGGSNFLPALDFRLRS